MQDFLKEEVIEKPSKEAKSQKIKPKKDFIIFQNEIFIELKKGEETEVPKKFLENLKTEKVI